MSTSYLKVKIDKLYDIRDINLLRCELYGVYTSLLFSKELFKNNRDIALFLESLNIHFKDYVLKSRTIIVAKMLRKIESSDLEALSKLILKSKERVYQSSGEQEKSTRKIEHKKGDYNYMNDMLNKYSRNKG